MTSNEHRVLVVAPTGRDAALICDLLEEQKIPCESHRSVVTACLEFEHGAGAFVLAEEALNPGALQALTAAFERQPKWSSVPVVLLSHGQRLQGAAHDLLRIGGRGHLVILERPTRPLTVRTALDAALETRFRQYQVRDYLEEQHRHEERLRHTQKLETIGILAGGVAHDFNNLLTGMLGNASLALEMLPPDHPASSSLDGVVRAAESAALLTRQLLAYSGRGKIFVEPLQLSEAVHGWLSLIRTSIAKPVRLQLELARDLPAVEADSGQIQQVVMNLIINAADSIPAKASGTVIVRTELRRIDAASGEVSFQLEPVEPGIYVAFEVQDTGTGIHPQNLPQIFDPFFTTKFIGRGLGLAAALGIVKGHRGAIQVSSVLGQGTRFTVLLPAATAAPKPPLMMEASSGMETGRVVLLVDDEFVIQSVAQKVLKSRRYHVLTASDGVEAMAILEDSKQHLDLVILDLTMPVMSGEETLRRLRRARPSVPVLLSSGYGEPEALAEFGDTETSTYLQKPYSAAELIKKVDVALSRKREPRA